MTPLRSDLELWSSLSHKQRGGIFVKDTYNQICHYDCFEGI